ncbi:MAG: site-specific integrase [Defluviitaleaceae bacterium]|nr:site-specific integrase [Defluviitaleaceae bacterium]
MPKRKAHGGGSIRQRKDGTWEARYTVGRDPGTGKQVQRSIYGKTQQEVRKQLAKVTVALDTGNYIEPSRLTLSAWLDIWLSEYNKDVKPRTLILYTGRCNYRIKPSLGATKLTALRPHIIQTFINGMLLPSNGKPALSPKGVRDVYGILHKALNQAVALDYINMNPAGACKLPRITKSNIKPLDNVMISSFLSTIKGHRYELFYIIDLFTGMRQSEILGLTWDCLQGNTIYVYRQLQLIDGVYLFAPLKNDKTRYITPAKYILDKFRERKAQQLNHQKDAAEAWHNEHNFIFTDEIGNHLRHPSIYKQFKRIMRDMNSPSTRFHDLRHSYAVSSLQAGDDIKTLQENLGHHTAAFTLDIYGYVTEQMRKNSSSRMDKFINEHVLKGNKKGKRIIENK